MPSIPFNIQFLQYQSVPLSPEYRISKRRAWDVEVTRFGANSRRFLYLNLSFNSKNYPFYFLPNLDCTKKKQSAILRGH